ncbi:uncharacterized protein METZ01_LOCUS271342 [marine metagenome]|uniref:Uncharacterized protein n=1 Tax=marine metagenome TaxID=408172 RepID=A0A382K2N0_9ZZZZ
MPCRCSGLHPAHGRGFPGHGGRLNYRDNPQHRAWRDKVDEIYSAMADNYYSAVDRNTRTWIKLSVVARSEREATSGNQRPN